MNCGNNIEGENCVNCHVNECLPVVSIRKLASFLPVSSQKAGCGQIERGGS